MITIPLNSTKQKNKESTIRIPRKITEKRKRKNIDT